MVIVLTIGTALTYRTGLKWSDERRELRNKLHVWLSAFPTSDRITTFCHPDTCSLRSVPKTEGE